MNNLDLKYIYEWPPAWRIGILSLIFLVVIFLGYFFDISRMKNSIRQLTNQEQDLKTQLKMIFQKQADLKKQLFTEQVLNNELKNWQKKIIPEKDIPDILNQVLKLGDKNGLKFISFTPSAATQSGDYFKIIIKAEAMGSYNQIATFISQVANLEKVVVISDFMLSNDLTGVSKNKEAAAEAAVRGILLATIMLEIYETKP